MSYLRLSQLPKCISISNHFFFVSFITGTVKKKGQMECTIPLKSRSNKNSDNSFLLYCHVHPSKTDYWKKKEKKKKRRAGTPVHWLLIWWRQIWMRACCQLRKRWSLSRQNDWIADKMLNYDILTENYNLLYKICMDKYFTIKPIRCI